MDTRTFILVIVGLAILQAIVVTLLDVPFEPLSEPFGDAPLILHEVELNPPCEDRADRCMEWVEIANATDQPVSLAIWYVSTTAGQNTDTVALAANGCPETLPADAYCVIRRSAWLENTEELLILNGMTIGRFYQMNTPRLTDERDDRRTWQLCPQLQRWTFLWAAYNGANRCF